MPELPEVETVKRGLAPKITHHKITDVIIRHEKLRLPITPDFKKHCINQVVHEVKRRAKYLLLSLDKGIILIHLGMSGHLRVLPHDGPLKKHDHVDIVFEHGETLRFNDPRRFGMCLWFDTPIDEHPLLAHLGVEPLTDDFNTIYLANRLKNKKQSIKSAIMDAGVVAGVGNIYACESLFLAGIHPLTPAGLLKPEHISRLVLAIKDILTRAIEMGGSTLRDFFASDGLPGYFAQTLHVYGRENAPCPVCKNPVSNIKITGRSTYFCGTCQQDLIFN